jgi:hypothetical protein
MLLHNHNTLPPSLRQELESQLVGLALEREALEKALLSEQGEGALLRRELDMQVGDVRVMHVGYWVVVEGVQMPVLAAPAVSSQQGGGKGQRHSCWVSQVTCMPLGYTFDTKHG